MLDPAASCAVSRAGPSTSWVPGLASGEHGAAGAGCGTDPEMGGIVPGWAVSSRAQQEATVPILRCGAAGGFPEWVTPEWGLTNDQTPTKWPREGGPGLLSDEEP